MLNIVVSQLMIRIPQALEFLPEVHVSLSNPPQGGAADHNANDVHSGTSNHPASEFGEAEEFDSNQSVADISSEDILTLGLLPNLDITSVEETLSTLI
ncbi:hypothetical protein KP79_PYT14538 [Mizuhopecten yessoensis]|uniref:Uncharacterized protein n=1 Tax=Mizuhopecten yessoensis TaxID=6573 RepID=A0A210R2N5_MIZYE|nr:hypothetical protein KP79_PYT14538 [Mizuhopecten yessoensis]